MQFLHLEQTSRLAQAILPVMHGSCALGTYQVCERVANSVQTVLGL